MSADARKRSTPSRLLSRPVWVGAALLLLGLVLGCMSFNINTGEDVPPNDPPPPANLPPGDLREQHGTVVIPPDGFVDVYYPIPFVSTPNLELSRETERVSLIVQRRDHFRIKNTGLFERTVRWDAHGVTVALNPPPAPERPLEPGPAPVQPAKLPPEPIPVTVKED
jgi:hypothetical protein